MATITDTYGIIESVRPASTDEVQFYVVPEATEINGVLRVCNQDSAQRTCRVAHCDPAHGDSAAEGKDFLWYDKAIPANDTREISIHANATEPIRIKASVVDKLSFHLSGQKKVTS